MAERPTRVDWDKLRGRPSPEELGRLAPEPGPGPGPELDRDGERLAAVIRADLATAAREQEPPGFEELAGYVDGTLEPALREAFESRLEDDPLLRQELRDLRELRSALERERARPARLLPFSRPVLVWGGLLAAAALVLALVRLRAPETPRPGPAVAAASPAPPAVAPVRLRLQDAGGELVLRADGSLEASGLEPDLARRTGEVLQRGSLPRPAVLDALQGRAGVLMGGESGPAAFQPLQPLGTCVRDGRPVFRWSALRGARAYVVAVFDDRLERAAESPELHASEWRPEQPLPRGRSYVWQVTALTGAGRVAAPAPPRPEARLRVLAPEQEQEVEARLAGAGGSRLAAAVVLAEAGLLDEAEQALVELQAGNPGTPELERLLVQVRLREAPGAKR